MAENYMKLAVNLAGKAKGRTSPNPLVGAVIVRRGKIVGKGYHHRAGEPHAEINAISDAGINATDSDLYLNLEPCDHYGRTPPCTEAIIKSGIRRVFVGMEDPNPRVSGRGINKLIAHGIKVETGILKKDCRKLNEVYIKYITTKFPFVVLKTAMSLDGKMATKEGDSRWITNEKSRRFVHKLRGEMDGVMVGIGTVLKDDPFLTCRLNQKSEKNPTRIVVDSKLRIPLQANILSSGSSAKAVIATTRLAPRQKIKQIEDLGVRVLIVEDTDSRVNLKRLMKKLGEMEITGLLIEGGSALNTSALEEGIVDKIFFFYAPKIIGGEKALPVLGGKGSEKMDDVLLVKNIKTKKFDDDFLIEGYLCR